MNKQILSWIAQVLVAIIMGQTLFFKFTDAPETVELFQLLGQGALAYKTIGALELIACILILTRPTIIYGALLSIGLMSGAIMAHLTTIGFSGPNGSLGLLAIAAWMLSCLVLAIRRAQIPVIGPRLFSTDGLH
ncbi:MAG: DoxX family protein [Verrucomicrobiota bacterium]